MMVRYRTFAWYGTAASLVLLPALPGVTAWAQGQHERPRLVLQALDTDHDGSLEPRELQAAPASLKTLDLNGDGQLTTDELSPRRRDAGADPDALVQQLMMFDKNGDGVLTIDELPDRMQPLFVRGDVNKDGKLTREEIEQMAAHTGTPQGTHHEGGHGGDMMHMDPLLNALDANHDGVISAEEISAAPAELATLDTNHDGTIEPDEMRMHEMTPQQRVAHVLGEFDTNGDGKLSEAEVPDGMRARFKAADLNGDDYLEQDELLQMFEAQNTTGAHGADAKKGTHD